jgi:hypothetical protein
MSWTWDLVLRAPTRPAVLIKGGRRVEIAAALGFSDSAVEIQSKAE